MTPFQSEDKVLVNGKHAEVKTLKDIGGGHFEVGVVYTEDKRGIKTKNEYSILTSEIAKEMDLHMRR